MACLLLLHFHSNSPSVQALNAALWLNSIEKTPLVTRTESSSKYSCSTCDQSRATATCPQRSWLSRAMKHPMTLKVSETGVFKKLKSLITAFCCLKHNFQLYFFWTILAWLLGSPTVRIKQMFYFLLKVDEIIITSSASLAAMWSGKAPYAQHSDCCSQETGGIIYYLPNQFKYCISFRKHISSLYKEIDTGLVK